MLSIPMNSARNPHGNIFFCFPGASYVILCFLSQSDGMLSYARLRGASAERFLAALFSQGRISRDVFPAFLVPLLFSP